MLFFIELCLAVITERSVFKCYRAYRFYFIEC